MRALRQDRALLLCALSALLTSGVACGRDGAVRGSGTTATSAAAAPGRSPSGPTAASPLASVSLRLTRVATLDAPLALATRAGDPTLYVGEQAGVVRAIRDGAVDPVPVLDITGLVRSGGEQGLLGIAFSADGSLLYANYTDLRGDTRVVELAMQGTPTQGTWADPGSRRVLLEVEQPYPNHNGGGIAVGPDGSLYIGLGDGGAGGDPHGYAQSLDSLLGKILRIDPHPSGGKAYTVPADNPFVGRKGARAEIWAYGLRNPWRFSFDRATGDLWIGDVGQDLVEEIDVAPAGSKGGENYGWNRLEGTLPFEGRPPAEHVLPVFTYEHRGGRCSVTGGSVSRTAAIPGLWGTYVFGDHCEGKLRALRVEGGVVTDERTFDLRVPSLSSFGEDATGTLYAMSLEGGVFRVDPA